MSCSQREPNNPHLWELKSPHPPAERRGGNGDRSPARPGDRLALELRVTNHGTPDATARASLIAPPGWSASPHAAEAAIATGETGVLRFVVEVPPGAHGRHVLRADLKLGARRFGQIAEALGDVA